MGDEEQYTEGRMAAYGAAAGGAAAVEGAPDC